VFNALQAANEIHGYNKRDFFASDEKNLGEGGEK
jgi:hypothetical protein